MSLRKYLSDDVIINEVLPFLCERKKPKFIKSPNGDLIRLDSIVKIIAKGGYVCVYQNGIEGDMQIYFNSIESRNAFMGNLEKQMDIIDPLNE